MPLDGEPRAVREAVRGLLLEVTCERLDPGQPELVDRHTGCPRAQLAGPQPGCGAGREDGPDDRVEALEGCPAGIAGASRGPRRGCGSRAAPPRRRDASWSIQRSISSPPRAPGRLARRGCRVAAGLGADPHVLAESVSPLRQGPGPLPRLDAQARQDERLPPPVHDQQPPVARREPARGRVGDQGAGQLPREDALPVAGDWAASGRRVSGVYTPRASCTRSPAAAARLTTVAG